MSYELGMLVDVKLEERIVVCHKSYVNKHITPNS